MWLFDRPLATRPQQRAFGKPAPHPKCRSHQPPPSSSHWAWACNPSRWRAGLRLHKRPRQHEHASASGEELSAALAQHFSITFKNIANNPSHILSFTEFTILFNRYTEVICTTFPYRRHKLLSYGGSHFYTYHKLFAAKCAIWVAQWNQCPYWGVLDTELHNRVFLGCRNITSSVCWSISHFTIICPFINHPFPPTPNHPSPNPPATSHALQTSHPTPPPPSSLISPPPIFFQQPGLHQLQCR